LDLSGNALSIPRLRRLAGGRAGCQHSGLVGDIALKPLVRQGRGVRTLGMALLSKTPNGRIGRIRWPPSYWSYLRACKR
jgi:hypothetical protein